MGFLDWLLGPRTVHIDHGESLDDIPPYENIRDVEITIESNNPTEGITPTDGTCILVLEAFGHNDSRAGYFRALVTDTPELDVWKTRGKLVKSAAKDETIDILEGWYKPLVVVWPYALYFMDTTWQLGDVSTVWIRYLEVHI